MLNLSIRVPRARGHRAEQNIALAQSKELCFFGVIIDSNEDGVICADFERVM